MDPLFDAQTITKLNDTLSINPELTLKSTKSNKSPLKSQQNNTKKIQIQQPMNSAVVSDNGLKIEIFNNFSRNNKNIVNNLILLQSKDFDNGCGGTLGEEIKILRTHEDENRNTESQKSKHRDRKINGFFSKINKCSNVIKRNSYT